MDVSTLVLCAVATAVAGCLGWGIRGVFGGPAGAMVPGALMGGTAGLLAWRGWDLPMGQWPVLPAAVGAAAFSIGGVMTYGQTLGLVHGPTRSGTYWWGLLGYFVKGALWFGTGAALLALTARGALSHPTHVLAMGALSVVAAAAGKHWLNGPMHPPRAYPAVYFSRRAMDEDDGDHPRTESWGGLLAGLSAVLLYGSLVLGIPGLWGLTLIGALAGGLGFAIGEAIQGWGLNRAAGRAWAWVDWWKVMEMTFGLIGGIGIGVVVALAAPLEPVAAPEPWSLSVAAIALCTWGALAVADGYGLTAAERWFSLPMVCGLLPLVGLSAAPQVAAPVLAGGAVLYLSALNTLLHWRGQPRPRAYLVAQALAVAAAAGAIAAMASWQPRAALVGMALAQTALVLLKELARQGPGGLRQRVLGLGAALPTVVSFLVLCVVLWLLIG